MPTGDRCGPARPRAWPGHIVLYATGYDHLDLELLDRYGVVLTTLPDYATVAVAEHGLAMLLALATRLHLANDRSQRHRTPGNLAPGVELAGRTVGVVGVGRIGRRLAGLCAGLGMDVLGCDPDPVACGRARNMGVEIVALDTSGGGAMPSRCAPATPAVAAHPGRR